MFLSLRAQSTSTKKPIYRIYVNGLPLDVECTITKHDDLVEMHEFETSLQDIHNVEIHFINKDADDTRISSKGEITEDLLLVLEKIKIDSIDLTNKLGKITVYKDRQGNRHHTFNYITFNGIYKIKIHNNPLYTEWLCSYF